MSMTSKLAMMGAAGVSTGLPPASIVAADGRSLDQRAAHVHQVDLSGSSVAFDYGIGFNQADSQAYGSYLTISHPYEKIVVVPHRPISNGTGYANFFDASNPTNPTRITTKTESFIEASRHSNYNMVLTGQYHKNYPFVGWLWATSSGSNNPRKIILANVGSTASECAVFNMGTIYGGHALGIHSDLNLVFMQAYLSSSNFKNCIHIYELTGSGILGGQFSNITLRKVLEHPAGANLYSPVAITGTNYIACFSDKDQSGNAAGTWYGYIYVYGVSSPANPVLAHVYGTMFFSPNARNIVFYDEKHSRLGISSTYSTYYYLSTFNMSNPTNITTVDSPMIGLSFSTANPINESYGSSFGYSEGDSALWIVRQTSSTALSQTGKVYRFTPTSSVSSIAIPNDSLWYENIPNDPATTFGGKPAGRISFV